MLTAEQIEDIRDRIEPYLERECDKAALREVCSQARGAFDLTARDRRLDALAAEATGEEWGAPLLGSAARAAAEKQSGE